MSDEKQKQALSGSAIHAEGLGKCYQLFDKPIHRLYDMLRLGGPRHRDFWAVRDLYLDVPHGSTVGIIGQNGAGKSTLLKLLSGISAPTTGQLHVQGRVASLLELGAGFHPEFSGRENVFLNCSILGMKDEEIEDRFESIVEFSELGEFIDRPVKTYSSGMYVRLGFAVASSVDPDILMIDEALSVGDEHFRGKCINRLNEFREQGKTTVFVSHDMGSVKTMCQHVVLMEAGRVISQGSAEEVADEYLKSAHERGNQRLSALAREGSQYPRWGTEEITTGKITLRGKHGEETRSFEPGDPFSVRVEWKANRDTPQPVFGLGVYRSDGTYVNGSNHHWREDSIDLSPVKAGEEGAVEMSFESLPLLQGEYYLTAFLYDHSKPAPTAIDHREHAAVFEVVDGRHLQHGLLYLPTTWTVEQGGNRRISKS